MRAVVSHSGHASGLHFATPWILVVAALGAGSALRAAGRGLSRQLPRPRWSATVAGAWAGSSSLLVTALLVSESSLGSGAWISVLVAVGLGLVLTASWSGARRLLSLARLRHRMPMRIRGSAVLIPCALKLTPSAPASLLAGWSDRGPPVQLS
ncbi:MAG: hypothetical protein WAL22_01610 [Solirubrobacteraceae bacterium]